MRSYRLWYGEERQYNRCMRFLQDICHKPKSKQIEFRIHVIELAKHRGIDTAVEAFQVSRSTIYMWMKRLAEGKGQLEALAARSRAPIRRRVRNVNRSITDFIIADRGLHPGIGKKTIKPALDGFCLERCLPVISESTIGRLIKDLKAKGKIVDRKECLRLNAASGKLIQRKKKLEKN